MQKWLTNLVLVFAIGYFAFNLWQNGTSRTRGNDFAHYYVSSHVWLAGTEKVYEVEFDSYYESLGLQTESNERLVPQATNPPGLLALFSPLTLLPPTSAYVVWNLIQATCLLTAILLCRSILKSRIEMDAFKILVSAFLLSQVISRHFYYSQVQLLLLVFILLAFKLSLRGRHRIACVLVCTATLVKIFPAFLLPWFVWQATGWQQRTKLALFSVTVLLTGICLSGVATWQAFLAHATAEISTWSSANTSLTISSLFTKIGVFAFDSHSVLFSYRSGVILSIGTAAILYLYALLRCRDKNIQFSLLTMGMLICGPTCWLHYLVFALFPICVICEDMREKVTITQMVAGTFLFLSFNHFFMTETNSLLILFLFKYAPLLAMIAVISLLIRKSAMETRGAKIQEAGQVLGWKSSTA